MVYAEIPVIPYSYAVSSKIEPFYKGGKVQVGCSVCVVYAKCVKNSFHYLVNLVI